MMTAVTTVDISRDLRSVHATWRAAMPVPGSPKVAAATMEFLTRTSMGRTTKQTARQ